MFLNFYWSSLQLAFLSCFLSCPASAFTSLSFAPKFYRASIFAVLLKSWKLQPFHVLSFLCSFYTFVLLFFVYISLALAFCDNEYNLKIITTISSRRGASCWLHGPFRSAQSSLCNGNFKISHFSDDLSSCICTLFGRAICSESFSSCFLIELFALLSHGSLKGCLMP